MTKLYTMTKTKIEKAINKLYSDNIAYKNLPKPYQYGMKIFKQEVVNFISSNFSVSRSVSEQIPTTWLDPLLTGKDKVIGEPPYNGKDIERLLTALKKRVQEAEKHCG